MADPALSQSEAIQQLAEQNPQLAEAWFDMSRQQSKAVFYRTLAVISTTLLGLGLFFAANQYQGAQDAAHEAAKAANVVREAAVENCQRSIKPGGVRFIIADGLRTQLDQSKTTDYSQFFPNVPPEQLKKLIDRQQEQEQRQIHDLLHINCATLYPKPTP